MPWDKKQCDCRDDWPNHCWYCQMYEEEQWKQEIWDNQESRVQKFIQSLLEGSKPVHDVRDIDDHLK